MDKILPFIPHEILEFHSEICHIMKVKWAANVDFKVPLLCYFKASQFCFGGLLQLVYTIQGQKNVPFLII